MISDPTTILRRARALCEERPEECVHSAVSLEAAGDVQAMREALTVFARAAGIEIDWSARRRLEPLWTFWDSSTPDQRAAVWERVTGD